MIKYIYVAILAVFLLPICSQAQPSLEIRNTTTKIADIYMLLPASDFKQLQNGMQKISQLGEAGYVTLIADLKKPGKENIATAEYAISGYSAYVMQSGKKVERKQSITAYGKALDRVLGNKNKAFIISQLALVGDDDAIPYLESYLTDPGLADPAARALVKINTRAAEAALLSKLNIANGQARLAIVHALGLCRVRKAAVAINNLVGQDELLTKISLTALAHIADPSSEAVIASAAKRSNYQYEFTNATAAMLIYAGRLLSDSNYTIAARMAKTIQDNASSDSQVHTRIAALNILIRCAKENPSALLKQAMDDANIDYRASALKLAGPYLTPETTKLWLKKLAKVDPPIKAEIVEMFGNEGSKSALPAIVKLLKNKNQHLKFTAISAASKIGQDQMVPVFYKMMQKSDSTTIAMITTTIQTMKGNNIAAQVATYLSDAKPNVQVALINILASRAANKQIKSIYSFMDHKKAPVRQAAFSALKQMVTAEDIPQLFTLFMQRSSPNELEEIQTALIAALGGTTINKHQMVDQVVNQMNEAPAEKKNYYFMILASLGGETALKAVKKAYEEGSKENKKIAVKALGSWSDPDVLPELINISRETSDTSDVTELLTGYLRLVETTGYTPELSYLKIRDAMAVAITNEHKKLILNSFNHAKTYTALLFTGTYLYDAKLAQTAAKTVMNIALGDTSLKGSEVKTLLNQTIEVLQGTDSEYQKQAIRKYLAEWKQEEGYVRIFNGKDLSGWKGLVANPIERSKMDGKTLKDAQKKADANMMESWKVINEELRFTSQGDNLTTVKKYGDFEMLVDWKIIDDKKQNGDAGIYLRGTPQVQIWDIARIKDGAHVGSGGLYNNQINISKPLEVADNKLDEWNTFKILMIGDRVTVYLNGILVTDNVILENYWDRSLPVFAIEQIELQAHGSPVSYRDIFIREIPKKVTKQLVK